MKSYHIGSRYILTEGLTNSVLVDFEAKKVFHINNSLTEIILSKNDSELTSFENDFDLTKIAGEKIKIVRPQKSATYYSLWFDISGVCNLKCNGCYAENFMHNSTEGRFVKDSLVDEVVLLGQYFQGVGVVGGEPFLNPDIENILQKLANSFGAVTVYTNGTIVNKDVIDFCKKNKIFLKISLCGINAAENDIYTKVKGSFNKKMNFIEYCKKVSAKFQVGYLITDVSTTKDIHTITDFLKNIAVDYKLDKERSVGKTNRIIEEKQFFKFKEKKQYTDNLFNHPCVNKKIGVDLDGKLYCCPMNRNNDLGSLPGTDMQVVLNKIETHWKYSMQSKYSDCNVCEFCALCFDCLAIDPIEARHPVNCSYNPNNGNLRNIKKPNNSINADPKRLF